MIWAEGRALTLEAAIVAALDTAPIEPRAAIEVTDTRAPELRIYALGAARVIVGERLLTSSDWTYTKARELLYYLASQPPVAKAQIGLDLSPDSSEHQLRNVFHRTLYYLRRHSQPESVVLSEGVYTFNRDLSYWCDVDCFNTHLSQASALGQPEALLPR